MVSLSNHADERYASLASPLKSVGRFVETTQEALVQEESGVLEGTTFKRQGLILSRRGIQVLQVGDLSMIAGRTTPVQCGNHSPAFSCFMAMPFVGSFTTRDGALCDEVCSGDIYLHRDYYATSTMGYLSSLFFALDQKRLDRTMRSISGGVPLGSLDTSLVVRGSRDRNGKAGSAGKMWSLIGFIDELHREHAFIPSCLGLDEQFYRLLSLCLLEVSGKSDKVQTHWGASADTWTTSLDDLVDYIRANAHQNLTLTDLEERSNYSARRLQSLFKEKLNCSPIQFIRRQRLALAMARLETAGWDDTVTTISRSAGYRHLATFTRDFQREFGVNPSAVLRASRGGKHP